MHLQSEVHVSTTLRPAVLMSHGVNPGWCVGEHSLFTVNVATHVICTKITCNAKLFSHSKYVTPFKVV